MSGEISYAIKENESREMAELLGNIFRLSCDGGEPWGGGLSEVGHNEMDKGRLS